MTKEELISKGWQEIPGSSLKPGAIDLYKNIGGDFWLNIYKGTYDPLVQIHLNKRRESMTLHASTLQDLVKFQIPGKEFNEEIETIALSTFSFLIQKLKY